MKVLLVFLLVGCGYPHPQQRQKVYRVKTQVETQTTCTTVPTERGALISCPDGSVSEVLHGKEGVDGKATNCTVKEVDEGAQIVCEGKSVLIRHGLDGQTGPQGADGKDCTKDKKKK